MGVFNDLPKDIVWLIFRDVVEWEFLKYMDKPSIDWLKYEDGYPFSNILGSVLATKVKNLAVLNHHSFHVVRRKCFKYKNGGWFFIRGAMS